MKFIAALATALILTASGASAANFPWWWSSQGGITPSRAQSLVNSEGLILHTAGVPDSQILTMLAYAGVPNLRVEWDSSILGEWGHFAQAGYKLDLIATAGPMTNCSANASAIMTTFMAGADALYAAFPGAIQWFEGVNEINNNAPCWQDVATATGSSGKAVNFSSGALPAPLANIVNSGLAVGVTVTDQTTPGRIPANTVMESMTPTSVTLSNNVTVAANDVLLFKTNNGYPNTATATGSSGTTVNFGAGQIPFWVPSYVTDNIITGVNLLITVTDTTTPGNIPGSTTIVSTTPTSITLSNSVTVANNDQLLFSIAGAYPSFRAAGIGWQTSIFNAVRADTNFATTPVWNLTDCCFAGVMPLSVFNNNTLHYYPRWGGQPLAQFPTYFYEANVAGGGTMINTEGNVSAVPTGNDGVDRTTQAIYEINGLLDAQYQFDWNGLWFIYELIDQGDGNSFFTSGGAPFQLATTYHNFNSVMNDFAANALTFTPTPVSYRVTGLNPPSSVHYPQNQPIPLTTTNYGGYQKLWQKANGNNYVTLWNEAQIWDYRTQGEVTPATSTVSVSFKNTYLAINVYDPMVQATPISTTPNASTVTVSLIKDPLIIETVTTGGLVPVIAAPATTYIVTSTPLAFTSPPGVSISEFLNQPGETFTVTVAGTTTTFVASGPGVSGSGTSHLTIAGNSLSTTNTVLGTLQAQGPSSDTIVINATDSYGNAGKTVNIAALPLTPAVTAPAATKIVNSQKTGIATVSNGTLNTVGPLISGATGAIQITEPGYVGETFTANITDANGLLSATGSGITGNNTTHLTISGLTLSAMNAALGSLCDTGSASDTITINVTNQYGVSAPAASITVSNIAAPSTSAVTALRANTFAANIGVDTHFTGYGGAYSQISTVVNAMNYLGIKIFRDQTYPGTQYETDWNAKAAAGLVGIQEVLTSAQCSTTVCTTSQLSGLFANMDFLATTYPGSILAVQGPNEINNQPVQYTNVFTATGSSGSTINTTTPNNLILLSATPNANTLNGVFLSDLTTPSAIPANTTISSVTSGTVVASNSVTVANGDVIQYTAFGNGAGPAQGGPAPGSAGAWLWQADVYAATKADPNVSSLPILYFIGGSTFSGPPFDSGLPAGYATATDSHWYQGYGEQIQCGLDNGSDTCGFTPYWINSFYGTTSPRLPQWVSETGLATCYNGSFSCVDYTSVGPLVLNDILDLYFQYQRHSYLFSAPPYIIEYELFDEAAPGSYSWGLFFNDGVTPKARGKGLKNLISILKDRGTTFTPTTFTFGIAGGNPPNNSANGSLVGVMQKRNGNFEIVLENEQLTYDWQTSSYVGCVNYPVTINFASAPGTVNIYDPTNGGSSPINSYTAPQAVTLQSCMDPLIIEVAPPPLPTIFDSVNTSLAIAKTNSNLTVTANANFSDYSSAHAIAGVATGKYFAEFTVNTGDGATGEMGVGIVNPSALLNNAYPGQDLFGVGYFSNGGVAYNGGAPATFGTFITGSVVDMAVDATDKLIWFRVNGGNWNGNGSSNPANGSGDCCGVSFSAMPGPYYPDVFFFLNGTAYQVTANFGATAYTYAAPSGYGNFLGNQQPTPAQMWGYNTIAMQDTWNSIATEIDLANTKTAGFHWYLGGPFPQLINNSSGTYTSLQTAGYIPSGDLSASGGVLTMSSIGTSSWGMFSCVYNGSTVIGNSFGGGWFLDVEYAFNPTLAPAGGSAWPTSWMLPIEFLNGTTANFVEIDNMECLITGAGACKLGLTNHDWNNSLNTNNGYESDITAYLPAGYDFTQMHHYQTLWVPAAQNNGTGLINRYVDGLLYSQQRYGASVAPVPALTPTNSVGALSEQDSQHQCLIMGTGYASENWPLQIGTVTVNGP